MFGSIDLAINCTEIVGNVDTRARGRTIEFYAVNRVKTAETREKPIVLQYILCIIKKVNKNKDLQETRAGDTGGCIHMRMQSRHNF